jgi:uncharacterized membrane protein HdeD (DUF308 family)
MPAPSILEEFARYWWVLLLRGILAIAFGVIAFTLPGLTLVTLVLFFGVYAIADGVTTLWVGARSRAWWFALLGVLGVLVGIYTFMFPGITAVALLYLIAAWAVVRGVFEIVTAIQLRKAIRNEWVLILSGAISILFGAALFVNPAAGALAMVWIIGGFAIAFGVMMIILAFRVRGLPEHYGRVAHG